MEILYRGGTMNQFVGRLAVQQRVFPAYRTSFYDLLAETFEGGLSVFAGNPLPSEGIKSEGERSGRYYVEGRNIHFSKPSSPYYLCWQQGIIPWLNAWNPDALIVEANPRYISNRQAIGWMKSRQKPVLGWGLGVPEGKKPFESMIRKRFLDSLDGVISYSERGADEYRHLGINKVFTAINAVVGKPEKNPPIREIGFGTKPTILFVGRMQARKRVDLLIRACKDLSESFQPNLIIIGDGPERIGLERFARNEYPTTQFLGSKHGDELIKYFESADIFVLPGTGGLAVQQAMSHGLPVIVAEGDGTQDDLVRNENGWQIRAGSQSALTSTLRAALSDVARLRRKGEASFRIVSEEINISTMVDSFIKALNEVRR